MVTDALAEPSLNLYSSRMPRLSIIFLNLNNQAKPFLQKLNFGKPSCWL